MIRLRFWCLLLCLLWPTLAHSTIYHVTVTGSGSACTSAAPCGNIMTGISKLMAGDTLYIHGGTYSQAIKTSLGTIPSGTSWSNPITIQAAPGETVTLAAHPAIDLNSTTNTVQFVIFDGLNIDAAGGTSEGMFCGGTTIHDLKFRNMEVKNAGQTGVAIHPNTISSTGSCANLEFSQMKVHNNGSGFFDHGFYTNAQNLIIRNSDIYANSGYGIQIYGSDLPGNSANNQIYNNRIHENGTLASTGGATLNHGDNIHFFNNLVYNNNGGGIAPACTSGGMQNLHVDNNLFNNNAGAAVQIFSCAAHTRVRNNLLVNQSIKFDDTGSDSGYNANMCQQSTPNCAFTGTPTFVNAGAGDFHLVAGSAGLNVGAILLEVPTDFDGVSRPQGTAYDLGPYERIEGGGAGCTSACTVFVAPSGSDSVACNAAGMSTPRQTVAGGIACLTQPGSTLYLRAGTYTNIAVDTSVTFVAGGTSWSAPTTIAGYANETVTLQLAAGAYGLFYFQNVTNDHYILLDRLILDAQNFTDSNGLIAYPGVHHIRFQNGEIKNTYWEPVYIYSANNIEILNTKVHDWTHEHGLHVVGTSDGTLFQGNEVYGGVGSGIRADTGDAPTGTLTNVTIAQNNVHGTGVGGSEYGITVGGSGATGFSLVNNLVWGNVGGITIRGNTPSADVLHNTVYSNTLNGIQIDTGATSTDLINNISSENLGQQILNNGTSTNQGTNLTVTPPFVNAGAGDFHLQASATGAINVGTTLGAVTTDYEGNLRPQGASYDIGAYEFVGTPNVPPTVQIRVPYWMTTGRFGR